MPEARSTLARMQDHTAAARDEVDKANAAVGTPAEVTALRTAVRELSEAIEVLVLDLRDAR